MELMRSGTELAREIQLTDWSMAGNLSNQSSGVQITLYRVIFVLCEVQLDNNRPYCLMAITVIIVMPEHFSA